MTDPSQPSCAPNAASPAPAGSNAIPPGAGAPPAATWSAGNGPVIALFAIGIPVLIGLSFLIALGIRRVGGGVSKVASEIAQQARASAAANPGPRGRAVDATTQSQAEALLARAASGDEAAAQQVLSASTSWTGRARRTARTDRFVTSCLNSSNFDVRGAGVAAQLAFENIPQNETGFASVERAVGNPNGRAWALWMLGALANRGIEAAHAAKVIGAYLADPDVRTRAMAVDALSLVGTDETIPMLLDRYRNDPSPIVQERAACDLSQAGMYTHAQRMTAARSLIGWVGDPSLTAQQRGWLVQALTDIAGKSFGSDPSAWQSWYNQQSSFN